MRIKFNSSFMPKATNLRFVWSATLMLTLFASSVVRAQVVSTPEEVRAIAREAYIYGLPVVDNYRIQYAYCVDKSSTEFKAPYNKIKSIPRVYTPEDMAVQTPNSDTPYTTGGLDLRAEPIVFTVPKIEEDRYFTIQLVDNYTHNFAYIGSRATGNGGGSFLIAGPNWQGEAPEGIEKVIRCETQFVFVVGRTQLFNPDDLENVKKIQQGYKVQKLSAFLGKPAPTAPAIDFIKPLSPEEQRTSLEYFRILNFVLQFCPTVPSETGLMERFAKISVGAGLTFDPTKLSPEMKTAIEQGMADGLADLAALQKKIDAGEIPLGEMFGTREFLKNNYLYRMAASTNGIYGNSKQDAIYPRLSIDSDGQPLDGSQRYTLRFAKDELPPVNAFWSLTMYKLPEILLVDNPIDRYLLNSPMLPQFKRDADGGLTLYIQNESPGKDKESNWLPAPKGPFITFVRLYWPKEEALNGTWTPPQLQRVK